MLPRPSAKSNIYLNMSINRQINTKIECKNIYTVLYFSFYLKVGKKAQHGAAASIPVWILIIILAGKLTSFFV